MAQLRKWKWAKPILVVLTLALIAPLAAHAQSSGSPFDTGFTALQNLFTGTIAKVASLIAIVIGGMASRTASRERRKLQAAQQEEALPHCFREDWSNGSKAKRILLPVRHLQQWIEQNIMLILKDAPFSKRDAQLVPAAGSCLDCPKRTGHNKLLFSDLAGSGDACSDPACYAAKLDAHVKQTVAAKPKLVQITTAYGKPAEGSAIVPRNQYVEIRQEKPQNKYQQDAPEYKPCKHTTDAIIAEGIGKGTIHKVCAYPNCAIHHPKKQPSKADVSFKAEQESAAARKPSPTRPACACFRLLLPAFQYG